MTVDPPKDSKLDLREGEGWMVLSGLKKNAKIGYLLDWFDEETNWDNAGFGHVEMRALRSRQVAFCGTEVRCYLSDFRGEEMADPDVLRFLQAFVGEDRYLHVIGCHPVSDSAVMQGASCFVYSGETLTRATQRRVVDNRGRIRREYRSVPPLMQMPGPLNGGLRLDAEALNRTFGTAKLVAT
jgi:hypothetical protein